MVAAADAPSELLDRYYTRVLGVAYQVLGDAALAARATDSTFERLLRQERRDRIEVWRIAVKVLRSYFVRGLTVAPLAPAVKGWQGSLLQGLARLEPEDRILLLLRYHEGLVHEQIAEVLATDVERIRQESARVRLRLMHALRLDDTVR